MCLVAVSEKPFCLRLFPTETKRVDGVFLQAVFQSIVLHWGNPNIDVFATSLNFKVTTFVSPVPDPRAYAVDAMSLRTFRRLEYVSQPDKSGNESIRSEHPWPADTESNNVLLPD
jgi:hypothetical protein